MKEKTVVCGYYGANSLGDDMILCGLTKIFNVKGVISHNPKKVKELFGLEGVKMPSIRRLEIFGFLKMVKLIRNSDQLLIGGGTIFADYGEGKGGLGIFKKPILILVGKLLGKRVISYGVGVAPPRYFYTPYLLRFLKWLDFIGVRNEYNKEILQKMGIKSNIVGDAVLKLKPKIVKKENQIGISIYDYNEDVSRHIIKVMKELINKITELGFNVVFLSLYPHDERFVLKNFKLGNHISSCLPNIDNVWEKFGKCKLVISMRLHSLTLSHMCGAKIIGINSDKKIEYFLKSIGFEQNIFDLKPNPEKLTKKVLNLIGKMKKSGQRTT